MTCFKHIVRFIFNIVSFGICSQIHTEQHDSNICVHIAAMLHLGLKI